MCGIVGFLSRNNGGFKFNPSSAIRQMIYEIKSRGPDFQDNWIDERKQICLGHTRLAIIDLNKRSNQPIHSKEKKWTIIFNGEIYNFEELKNLFNDQKELTGDTSVLIALIEKYGFESSIKKIDGMFAIAAWDHANKKLFLTRDRMGEKPLYYSIDEDIISFGSNVNSLKILKNKPEISEESVNAFFKLNYIPSGKSIFKNIFKLVPGSYLVYSLKSNISDIKKYWNLDQNPKIDLEKNLVDQTSKVLNETIKRQLVSDVDIGTFLSGGIDSSIITALIKNHKIQSLKTFTLSSGDYNFDESERAKKISNYLGYENLSFKPTKEDILSTITNLPKIYGEPFGDSSQIPTILISKFARNYVKVVLSGDGGDEMFGGYNRYKFFHSIYPKLKYIPTFLLKKIGFILKNIKPDYVDFFFKNLNLLLPQSHKKYNFGYSLNKFGRLIECEKYEDSFYSLISNAINLNEILLNQDNYNLKSDYKIDNIENVIRHDLLNYLPDDILCKIDRASMAHGLEVRAPFVDRSIVELSQQIPFAMKFKNGQTKFILREILKKYLPGKLYSGQKRGFSVPISLWLRNELKETLMDYSSKSIISKQNIFNYKSINKVINDHISNKKNNEKFLWSYLVFQTWYFQNK